MARNGSGRFPINTIQIRFQIRSQRRIGCGVSSRGSKSGPQPKDAKIPIFRNLAMLGFLATRNPRQSKASPKDAKWRC